MTWVGLALSGVVGMAEASAVIQEATPTGQYSASALFGLGRVTAPASPPYGVLDSWAQATSQLTALPFWLCVYLGFNLLALAGWWLLGRLVLPADQRSARWLLTIVALAVILQDGLALLAFLAWVRPANDHVPWFIAWPLNVAVIVKWAAILALLARVGYWAWRDHSVGPQVARIARALKKQRFSVVVLGLLAVLAVARGFDVLEQLPDLERAWLTGHPSLGWVHWAAAIATLMMLLFLLLYLGRLRVRRAQAALPGAKERREPSDPRMWLLFPAALLVLAAVLRGTSWAAVSWLQVAAVPVVMWGIAGVSRLAAPSVRRREEQEAGQAGKLIGPGEATARVDATRTAGDLLAVGTVAVAGLGLVRAFTAPALVVFSGYAVASGVAVVMGVAVAAGCWPVACWLRAVGRSLADNKSGRAWRPAVLMADWARRGLPPWSGINPNTGAKEAGAPWRLLAAAAPFLAADVFLIFVPLWTTHWLGGLAVVVIAFATLAVGLALLARQAQSRQALPAFRLLRLKSTPVITVAVLIAVIGAELNTNSTLHNIRVPATPSAAPPQDLQASLWQWLHNPATTACAVPPPAGTPAPGGLPVRVEPLVLVAAAGGGIRAAWWTEHALDAVADLPCGPHAVFAVSSVSGSSIGLAVMATTSAPGTAILRMAGPDALSAALDGLLLRDMIAGFTGLDLTAAQMPHGPGQRYPDRAALIESAWTAEDPALAQPFPLTRPVLPWRMLLNSTAVRTGCRAIIADRPLTPAVPSARPTLTCTPGSAGPAAYSYDFLAALPCLNGLDTVTAALLSARFPFVTPAGRVSACGQPTEQYVDGGYSDSTGLSTLADLAPTLVTAIRAYNTHAVASAAPGRAVTIVVPVTVYLGNSAVPEPVPGAAPGSPPEPFIPLTSAAKSSATQLIGSTASMQRLAAETAPSQLFSCTPAAPRCTLAQNAVAARVPRQLILVAPRTYPRVAAPLGWILSEASRNALTTALQMEADPRSRCGLRPGTKPYCPAGIGRLSDLIYLITGR